MPGLIGKKIGMTSLFDENGKNLPCTVIEVEPNEVIQIKTADKDGYEAVQIGSGKRREKSTPKAQKGHFEKAKVEPKVALQEFKGDYQDIELKPGIEIKVGDLITKGELVDVTGTSKGKGFQGVVKRHGFHGVGDTTHGQKDRLRAPGSVGGGADPSRIFKGMRMAGRTGNNPVMVESLKVLEVDTDKNLVVVKGSVPGAKNSFVTITK